MPAKRVDFKHIKAAADFLRVLGHYNIVPIGKGVERQALCPFHRETKPSFKVNLGRKVFHCFGCNAGGDVIKFVCLAEGLDPEEPEHLRTAAKRLAEICDIEAAPSKGDPVRRARKPVAREKAPETKRAVQCQNAAPCGSCGLIQ